MLLFSWFVMLGIWMPQETQVGGIVQEGANLLTKHSDMAHGKNTLEVDAGRCRARMVRAD